MLAALAALVATPGEPAALARAEGGPAASEIRVERLTGDSLAARRLVAVDAKHLTFETAAGNVDVPLDDVVEVAFATAPDAERPWSAGEVAIDLWTGESILGELRGGDVETVDVQTRHLGTLRFQLERIAAIRFLQRLSQAAEPPDLRPKPDADVVHVVGGDAFGGTLESFGKTSIRSVTPQKDTIELPFERLVAITLMADAKTLAKPRDAAPLQIALRDGTRVVAREAKTADGRLTIQSPSGFTASCPLGDVVALQVTSGRFAYLSDLPATVKVKPVWDVAAGDPAVLFAPRMDRSFSGRPLRCGGRTWLDGIGVFSGTTLTWDLAGKYRELRTSAGLDDGAGPLGGVVFQVLVDGKEVWSSGFVRPAKSQGRGKPSPVASPRISLEGAKSLQLVVLAGDADDPYPVQDEADWLGPIVVRAAEK